MSEVRVEASEVAQAPAGLDPLSYSIEGACLVSGMKKSRLYELIASGHLQSVKIGRRRLVKADSLKRLLAEGC